MKVLIYFLVTISQYLKGPSVSNVSYFKFQVPVFSIWVHWFATLGNTTMRKGTYWVQQNHPSHSPWTIRLSVSPDTHTWVSCPELFLCQWRENQHRQRSQVQLRGSCDSKLGLNLDFIAGQVAAPSGCTDSCPGAGMQTSWLGWVETTALQKQKFNQPEFHSQHPRKAQACLFLIRVWWHHYESFFQCITAN